MELDDLRNSTVGWFNYHFPSVGTVLGDWPQFCKDIPQNALYRLAVLWESWYGKKTSNAFSQLPYQVEHIKMPRTIDDKGKQKRELFLTEEFAKELYGNEVDVNNLDELLSVEGKVNFATFINPESSIEREVLEKFDEKVYRIMFPVVDEEKIERFGLEGRKIASFEPLGGKIVVSPVYEYDTVLKRGTGLVKSFNSDTLVFGDGEETLVIPKKLLAGDNAFRPQHLYAQGIKDGDQVIGTLIFNKVGWRRNIPIHPSLHYILTVTDDHGEYITIPKTFPLLNKETNEYDDVEILKSTVDRIDVNWERVLTPIDDLRDYVQREIQFKTSERFASFLTDLSQNLSESDYKKLADIVNHWNPEESQDYEKQKKLAEKLKIDKSELEKEVAELRAEHIKKDQRLAEITEIVRKGRKTVEELTKR